MSDGSWLGTWAYIERTTAMSSACAAVLAKSSLISNPLLPYLENLKGDGKAAPVLRSVRRYSPGNGWPANLASAGLGSNVSTCEGPPFRKKWMTRFAFGAKCGARAVSGEGDGVSAWASAPSERAPMPRPARARKSRRLMDGRTNGFMT